MHLDRVLQWLPAVQAEQQEYKYHMRLTEVFDREPQAYQDLSADNSQVSLGDLRKTRLTLRQLNKLRKMNDIRSYEQKEKLKLVRKQYSPPAQPLA